MSDAGIIDLGAEAEARLAARGVRGGALGDDGGEMESKALIFTRVSQHHFFFILP